VTKGKSKARKARKGSRLPRQLALNELTISSKWSEIDLKSGTSGTISVAIAPSIQNTTEYSTLTSLFTEVRLIKATYRFYAVQANSTTVLHSKLSVGISMLMTAVTYALPTAYSAVVNLRNSRTTNTWRNAPFIYNYSVPRDIEHSAISQDSPSTPTPYAGSPGALVIFADDLSVTTTYFRVEAEGIWHLRSRT